MDDPIENAIEEIEPFIDDHGMVTFDKLHEHTGDSLHHSGFYYLALSLLNRREEITAAKFRMTLNQQITPDGSLLRYQSKRANTRDQYTPVFAYLWQSHFRVTAVYMFRRMEETAPLFMTGKDVNAGDHWAYFARCAGIPISYWRRLIADSIFVVGMFLTIRNMKSDWAKVKEDNLGHVLSPFSDYILRFLKAWVNAKEQPTFISKWSWRRIKKVDNELAFTHYFSKWASSDKGPPIHKLWVYILSNGVLDR